MGLEREENTNTVELGEAPREGEDSKATFESMVRTAKSTIAQERITRGKAESLRINNGEALRNAERLISLSKEELQGMPFDKILTLARGIKWNQWEDPYTKNSSPEEIFNAEAKLYEGYSPSGELIKTHRVAYEAALGQNNPATLLKMERGWKNGDTQERLKICQNFIDKLCEAYGLPKVECQISTSLSNETADTVFAQYMPTGTGKELGRINLSKNALEQNDVKDFLEFLVHETGHAYQDAAIKGVVDSDSIADDVEWFKLSETLHRDYERGGKFKKDHERYLKLPIEQDAHRLQREASSRIKTEFANAEDALLRENGLPSMITLDFRRRFSKWMLKNLESNPNLDGNNLLPMVEQALKLDDSKKADVLALFGGKNHEECLQQTNTITEQFRQAQTLLYGEA